MSSGAKKREGSSSCTAAAESSDVDEMIRAAEDEFLIGLRVGSHTIFSSRDLDLDLARRFQALQSPRPSPHRNLANPSPQPWAPQTDQIRGDPKEEDLLARFAALKGDVISDPRSRTVPAADPFANREDYGEEDSEDGDGVSKEVEKVMRWAMDAARLDPSRNDDDEEHGKEKDEEEVDEELESEEEEKNKVRRKGKPGKWFSFFR